MIFDRLKLTSLGRVRLYEASALPQVEDAL
jgi:hypothetical protein